MMPSAAWTSKNKASVLTYYIMMVVDQVEIMNREPAHWTRER